MEGVRIACLYSFGCPELKDGRLNSLTFDPFSFLYGFIKEPDLANLGMILALLNNLEPILYYRLIARSFKTSTIFSEEVVRNHWLGSVNLTEISPDVVRNLSENCPISPEAPRKEILEKIRDQRIPRLVRGKPHHNFVVLQALNDFGKKRQVIANINHCLIRPGTVVEKKEGDVIGGRSLLMVKTFALAMHSDNTLYLKKTKIEIERGFLEDEKEGDIVSFHFGVGREKITYKQAECLLNLTNEALQFHQSDQKRD